MSAYRNKCQFPGGQSHTFKSFIKPKDKLYTVIENKEMWHLRSFHHQCCNPLVTNMFQY